MHRTLSAREAENSEEREFALSLTMWVQNELFSPCPPSGEGVALSSPSPEIKQLPTSPGCLCQGRFIASLDDIRASWNTGGAALLREARRAGLRFSTGGHRRAPTATSRLGLALQRSGASRRGKMCCLGLLLYCRELLGTVLDSVAEQSSLGDESVEKAHFQPRI